MTTPPTPPDPSRTPDPDEDPAHLEGEPGIPSVAQGRRVPLAWKGLFAVALAGGALLALVALLVHRAWPGSASQPDARSARPATQPAAAGAEPKRLDMTAIPKSTAASVPASAAIPTAVIPALQPTEEELAGAPIGVQRTPAHRTGRPVVPRRMHL